MSKSTGSNTQFLGRGADPAKLRDFLRAQGAVKEVSARLGTSPRNVENWRSGVSEPRFCDVFRLIEVFGADFLCAVMSPPPAWASDALARAELAALERQSADLKAKIRASERASGGARTDWSGHEF